VKIAIAAAIVLALSTATIANNKRQVSVEVVDTSNVTQSQDVRQNHGLAGALMGRQTLTDAASMNAVIDGEHAKLDCFEHRKGCTTMGPGTYDGEMDTHGSIWITYEMPLTHKRVRNHYVVRGSW
jgi:hypothetical protein